MVLNRRGIGGEYGIYVGIGEDVSTNWWISWKDASFAEEERIDLCEGIGGIGTWF